MFVLALGGYRESGKDTAAEVLQSELEYTRYAFADRLKDMVASAYKIDRRWFDDDSKKGIPLLHMPVVAKDKFTKNVVTFMAKEFVSKDREKFDYAVFSNETGAMVGVQAKLGKTTPLYWSPRSLIIMEGSIKRTAQPYYWVDAVIQSINGSSHYGYNVVITDLRYKAEANRLKESFGDNIVFARIVRNESTSDDPSERDLDDFEFDYYIYNRKTKEDLYSEVRSLNRILESQYV